MAVQSLQNLGITDAQTEELANTRQARPYLQVRSPASGVVLSRKLTLNQWFKAGEEFYTIADIGKVWVYADVYEDEAMHMRPGMTVAVKHEQMGKTFSAKVGKVLPLFDPTARTLKVRIDVDNPRYELRPDMFVDVEIPITLPPSLSVPADAVLDSGTRAIVYVDKGNGIFEPRRVKTGWSLGGQVEITDGLTARRKDRRFGKFPDRFREPDGARRFGAGRRGRRQKTDSQQEHSGSEQTEKETGKARSCRERTAAGRRCSILPGGRDVAKDGGARSKTEGQGQVPDLARSR